MLLKYKLSDKTQIALRLSAKGERRGCGQLPACASRVLARMFCGYRVPTSMRCGPSRAAARGKPAINTRDSAPVDHDPYTMILCAESKSFCASNRTRTGDNWHWPRRLTLAIDGGSYRWDTWGGLAWPRLTAQIWRPTQPNHKGNGAQVLQG